MLTFFLSFFFYMPICVTLVTLVTRDSVTRSPKSLLANAILFTHSSEPLLLLGLEHTENLLGGEASRT